MKCPVCGKFEFEEYGDFDICPVCNRENDNLKYDEHNYSGGANDLSVNEARIEYFLLNFSTTKKKAKELHDDYSKVLVSIIHRYGSYDRVSEQEKAEQEIQDYRNARKDYVDKLNELLLSILS